MTFPILSLYMSSYKTCIISISDIRRVAISMENLAMINNLNTLDHCSIKGNKFWTKL